MKTLKIVALAGLMASAIAAAPAGATTITFEPGSYDNTANTVTTGAVTHNNQTTGNFRDAFWWQINNGDPKVGSADFINSGNKLILSANHAIPGSGPLQTLNFTGPAISGGQSYISLYDATPGDGAATKNLFDASQPGGITISTDVLFIERHSVSAGIVTMFNEGQDGLAVLIHNGSGNNADHATVDLVWRSNANGQQLLSTANLPAASFIDNADSVDAGHPGGTDHWYRIVLQLLLTGDTWSADGEFYNHTDPTDPTSGLGSLITSIFETGSMSNPDGSACSASPANNNTCLSLTNPGEIGLIVQGNESISLPDSVGVSFYDLTISTNVPEPATLPVLGLGLLGLGFMARRQAAR